MGQETEFSAKLVTEDGIEHVLSGEMKVGRVAECDITIEDPKVSRAHAMIRVEGERVTVEDLGSANGSRINDKRADGVAQFCSLVKRDNCLLVCTKVKVGDTEQVPVCKAPLDELSGARRIRRFLSVLEMTRKQGNQRMKIKNITIFRT